MLRYFLYARKSTDEEDRQVRSIEAQLTELHEFAATESLTIVEEFIESKTAKTPGRPIFNAMMERIQNREADGILAWHPDRLARNSVDGGLIIHLLDENKLQALKFLTFWFENTPQGKFMLNIAFGQSKYYVDNLRENVLRGVRQKLRRGEFPSLAPIGYLNDVRTHKITRDPDKGPLVRRMFEVYAAGRHTVPALRELVVLWGLQTRHGKPVGRTHMWRILSNPFYMGLMRINGELYEGAHEPLISKALFDKVQEVLRDNAKPRYKAKSNFAFLGLLKCAHCGCCITAEKQKGHHYYHCTKKRGPCPERYVREEELAAQLREIIAKVSLPESWKAPMMSQLETWRQEERGVQKVKQEELNTKIGQLNLRLERLLNLHLEGSLTSQEYKSHKAGMLTEKADLQEKSTQLTRQGSLWLEPAKELLEAAFTGSFVSQEGNLDQIFDFLKNARSNLELSGRRARGYWPAKFSLLCDFDRNSEWGE